MGSTLHDGAFVLIERGDGSADTITVCLTAEARREATALAVFGENWRAPEHAAELEKLFSVLEENGIVEFEGDPPVVWLRAWLRDYPPITGGR